jgi:hypothetical protein
MKSIVAVLVLIAGCDALVNNELGERYPPSPPPDPTEAILATERAATQPSPPPRVIVVPFPDTGLRPGNSVEAAPGEGFGE